MMKQSTFYGTTVIKKKFIGIQLWMNSRKKSVNQVFKKEDIYLWHSYCRQFRWYSLATNLHTFLSMFFDLEVVTGVSVYLCVCLYFYFFKFFHWNYYCDDKNKKIDIFFIQLVLILEQTSSPFPDISYCSNVIFERRMKKA